MTFYVGIDVGIQSGIAVLNEDGSVYYHTTVTKDVIGSLVFRTIAMHGNLSSHVCIEYPEPDATSRTQELVEIMDAFAYLFPTAHRVRPGNWKNAAVCLSPLPANVRNVKLSTHEKDAINIARWYKSYLETHAETAGRTT